MKTDRTRCFLGIGLSLVGSIYGCGQLTQPNVAPPTTNPSPATVQAQASSQAESSPKGPDQPTTASPQGPSSSPSDDGFLAVSMQSAAAVTAATVEAFAASRPPLTLDKIKAAEYYFLAKGPVKLSNGKYEDPDTKRVYEMSDVVTYGDINQDGIKDAVTALKVAIPNSGNFMYLVAVVNSFGEPKNISTEFMGPEIKVKSLTIQPDNSIQAVMAQYLPGDDACCPRLTITRTYKLREQQTQPTEPMPEATK